MKFTFEKPFGQLWIEIINKEDTYMGYDVPDLKISIDGDQVESSAKVSFYRSGIALDQTITILINGKETQCNGFKIPDETLKQIDSEMNRLAKIWREDAIAEYIAGKRLLKIDYREGEYLSGYSAFGLDADILKELHLAKDISGWGTLVDDKVYDTLTTEFTYEDAHKLAQPYLTVLKEREQEKAKKKEAEEKEKAEIMANVADISHVAYDEYDEGGRVQNYISTVTFCTGESYAFEDRNVFDAGRCINPKYEIAPGLQGGLLIRDESGCYFWQTHDSQNGWYKVRELETLELQAYQIVKKYGRYADNEIRM